MWIFSLIILCEDVSFIGYEYLKIKVCMVKNDGVIVLFI